MGSEGVVATPAGCSYALRMAVLARKTLTIQRIGEACGVLLPCEEFPFLKTGDRVDVRMGEGRTIVITLLGEDESREGGGAGV